MENKKNKKIKEYNIGLDIGTNSVGWAVTDLDNNILKHNSKNMWGARLFEEGKTAAETRSFRGARRRIERRRERINILQSLMLDDVEKEYPNFFPMLRETSKIKEEKNAEAINGKKYNLFSELNFSDATYYKKYPTIYHLREDLIKTQKKLDIRLVYLAIHHIIKYRGNFLYEGDLKSSNDKILDSVNILVSFIQENLDINFNSKAENICRILMNKEKTKVEKKDELLKLFDYDKSEKSIISNIISAILGYKFDVNKIFESNLDNSSISFSNEIANEEEIKEAIKEQCEIYEILQRIYSWFVLQDILQGNTNISTAFINKYNKYKKDLKLLKKVYKDNLKNEYNKMFRIEDKNSYAVYDKNISKCSRENLYKRIKQDLDGIDGCNEKEEILKYIENDEFLVKINTTENAAIPYQLHYQELEKILENQSQYYLTIKENKQHILELMKFRIPYYIGPLAKSGDGKFSWIVRNSDEKILPWTFEKIVDTDKTAEKFIKRMTNKCTYLLNEDVIPKQSILYSEFCVLNELANIKVNNHKLAPKEKEMIIEKLFKYRKTVKLKEFKQFLIDYQIYKEVDSIIGLAEEDKFISNMSSYIEMKEILGNIDGKNIEMVENIIEWITIFEDKKILKRKIKKEYNLDDNTIEKLAKKNYNGWSRLSKKLLTEMKSYDDNKSVMEKLKSTRENFMQIINNTKYGFDKQIEEKMREKQKDNITYEEVNEIPTSPANKKAIWQCLKIVKEITKIMKREPKNIYIEFAREEQEKKKRNDTRAKQLLKIYEKYEEQIQILRDYNPKIYKELKNKQNDKDFNERLYLYFTQNGRCMYSSKPLNIDTLYLYEVDHVLPQSYVKDDSLSNKVLVYKKENQRKSDSLLLNEEIINRQQTWWKQLRKSGLIDDKKYNNLIRRKMFETNYDKVTFISRQLVETRQSTKYIANLLLAQYKNTDVFTIRSQLTHRFREYFEIYKNRNINDYHHAQDAYIISVIGNVIDTKFYFRNEYKYAEYVKSYIKKEEEEKDKKNKPWIIMKMISNNINHDEVKRNLNYKDCYVTRKLEEQTGAFYNQTLYSPKDKNVLIPLKENMQAEKYGGYSNEYKAYFVIYSYIDSKGKKQLEMSGVPVKIAYDIKNKRITLVDYITTIVKNISEVKIIKGKILKYQEYINKENEQMVLLSDSEVRTNKQLIVIPVINRLIYIMNKEKITEEEKEEIQKEMQNIYDYLLEKLKNEYKVYESIYQKLNDKKIRKVYENLTYEDKKMIINGLIDLMHKGQGNLKKLNQGDRAGRKTGKSFKTKELSEMTFVDKSITGMYERRYRVNGMENYCSN